MKASCSLVKQGEVYFYTKEAISVYSPSLCVTFDYL